MSFSYFSSAHLLDSTQHTNNDVKSHGVHFLSPQIPAVPQIVRKVLEKLSLHVCQ